MKTIAEAAGVSVMTVSRALRNQPVLSQATRTRIQGIAKEIGYRPNPMVSTLMAQLHGSRTNAESPIICYATAYPDPNHWRDLPYNVDAYNGAARRAETLGYRLEHFCLTEPGMTVKRACRVLRARGVVGLLMAPLPIPPPPSLDLNWEWFACASIGYALEEANLHHAMVDHVAVMRLVYRSLRDLGYRRIGLAIRPVDDTEVDNKWISGFCTEQFFGPAVDRVPICLEADWCEANVMRWYLEHRPEAVITVHTEVIDWLKRAGLRIPRDVGVAMPDLSFRPQFPDLSGVDQRTELVGEIALDLVVEQIHHNQRGIPQVAKIVMVEGTWVPGKNVRQITPARKRAALTMKRAPASAPAPAAEMATSAAGR